METAVIDQFSSTGDPVQIVRSGEEARGLREYRLKIQYPDRWFAPLALSPFAKSIEEETVSWMQGLDLIKDDHCLAHVLAMEPRHYAGYSHSMASYDHALMYCKYITMWLLWDDERVEVAKEFDEVEGPLVALRGDRVAEHLVDDPYVHAFKHIGDEYERLGASRRWRQRFADRMSEWAAHAIQEEVVRRNHTENGARSFDEAVKLRAVTVGIRPNSIPLERAVGIELSDEFVKSEEYELMLECAARVCCIINDVVGVPKDIANNQRQSNLIIYYMMIHETSLLDAYRGVLKVHDDAIDTYDKLTMEILRASPSSKREKLSYFFDNLRYMDTGFGMWHRDCVRYQDRVAAQGGQSFRISIGRRV
ncbi:(-)-delta-cadinene synthase [Burkholderia lata]|uniref:terpene synthase family protein n=1 Tax=Burkholderia lata (strain ATCC 17760 / DSM 23089 / LMG 22485 / NCIMB 9086 / R18194 / 383) TaxID=482957 RepID=UPI0014542F87|nr:terpene synthase family protein [Burkholderia lata]VWD04427.1 (-)-delta-cadinene synthase [Burkholderia lata]